MTSVWAQKAGVVTMGASSPTALTMPVATNTSKNLFMVKSTVANGTAPDDEWEGFPTKENKLVQELEMALSTKDKYIEELVAQVDERDRRTSQLETEVTEQRRRIVALEVTVEALRLQSELSESRTRSYSIGGISDTPYIAAAAPSKAEGVASGASSVFNDEVNGKADGEAPQVVQPEIEVGGKANSEVSKDAQSEIYVNSSVSEDAVSEAQTEAKVNGKADGEVEVIEKAESAQSSPKAELPALPRASSPVSNEVKPAPKLSFPIQNGGKIPAKPSPPVTASNSPPKPITGSWSAGKAIKDIRDMPQAARIELANSGSVITVFIGSEKIVGVPKHMFMAASSKAREYFIEHPQETHIAFKVGAMAIPVMQLIKEWLVGMSTQKAVFSLRLRGILAQDLAIRRDCIFLGMDKYVAHFTRQYCDKVREGLPPFDVMAEIEKNTPFEDDALLKCLCNNLANARVRKTIPDPEKLDRFLSEHPRLAKAVDKVEARIRELRAADAQNQKAKRQEKSKSKSRSPRRSKSQGRSKSQEKTKPQGTEKGGRNGPKPTAN